MVQPVRHVVEPVVSEIQVPPGMLGPDPVSFDVRCFIVPYAGGIVLVDVGPSGNSSTIDAALARIGAAWSDVSDVVLTHAHFDHAGALAEAADRAAGASLWAGAMEVPEIRFQGDRVLRELVEGDRVRNLKVLDTPGHTPGHISLLHETGSLLLIGDLVGSVDGALSFGPAAFTADPKLSRQSLARMADIRPDRVVFSHGAEVIDPNTAIRGILAS
jgi:glyoxylase-like metal-dependent hydrolase (beta-lactamase superfamily II)